MSKQAVFKAEAVTVASVGRDRRRRRGFWPFAEKAPDVTEWLWCGHCGRMFTFADAVVVTDERWPGQDFIECPYADCEGSAMDFWRKPRELLGEGEAPEYGVVYG